MDQRASRFVRGRGRGGGAYRPYFYFKRNGRTVPGFRGSGPRGSSNSRGPSTFMRGDGAGRARRRNALTNTNIGDLNSSFFRSEFYVAPENAVQISSLNTDCPVQCPGWRLYFPSDDYKENSAVAKRIKLLEAHYNNYPVLYDLLLIQSRCSFKMLLSVLLSDANVLQAWPSVSEDLQAKPETTLAIFGVAMHVVVTVAALDASLSQPQSNRNFYYPPFRRVRKIYPRLFGVMGVKSMTLISNMDLDRLYCVRGYVDAVGEPETRSSWVAYKCGRCGQEQALKQHGFSQIRPHNCLRSECHAKGGFVEQRSSPYTQITSVQKVLFSELNLGKCHSNSEIPTSLEVELHDDLVDSLSPGEDFVITGILKVRPLTDDQRQQQTNTLLAAPSHNFRIYMQASSVEDARRLGYKFSEHDMEAITAINSEPESFKLLVRSLAPEVHGQEMVKAGVLLSLFGGAGSQVHDGSEINVLLVGDPGVGKSSLLQTVSNISTRGVFTNGKRTSSASQQLAVSTQGRSHITVQAGSLISSITGHCAIDDVDRLASQQETLLQVMQSQTLSLPFPRIFATFNAPTSIMATANSVRGHYDHSKLLTQNVRVHPALLRQFHLVFVLLDKPDKNLDISLTEHIKALHTGAKKTSAISARFENRPKFNNSMSISAEAEGEQHYDLEKRLQLQVLNGNQEEEELDLLPPELIKKFIVYARQQLTPLLTKEAADNIKDFYMELRSQSSDETWNPFTISSFEGLIRLTQARARSDFATEVNRLHVRDVLCIVRQSISDTSVGDYIDRNPATSTSTGRSQSTLAKKFIQTLQLRSNVLGRRVFDFDELKDIARRAGISCGVTNLVDIANLQGFLLKKGPNIYEVMED